jgi:hypothetical protein
MAGTRPAMTVRRRHLFPITVKTLQPRDPLPMGNGPAKPTIRAGFLQRFSTLW